MLPSILVASNQKSGCYFETEIKDKVVYFWKKQGIFQTKTNGFIFSWFMIHLVLKVLAWEIYNFELEFAKKSHNTVTITFLCGSNCYETDFMNCISLFTKTETILSFFRSTVCGNASPTEFFEYWSTTLSTYHKVAYIISWSAIFWFVQISLAQKFRQTIVPKYYCGKARWSRLNS